MLFLIQTEVQVNIAEDIKKTVETTSLHYFEESKSMEKVPATIPVDDLNQFGS